MKKMRLDRYLAECGCGTRSEVKSIIKKGRVTVNGETAGNASSQILIPSDEVCLDGRRIEYEEFRYYMLNKPQGCITATRDGLSATVLDILADENTRDLFPVGRLDKDTEGLLLITNDGQLAHRLLSPRKHVDKRYIAAVSRALGKEELARFRTGLDIGDEELTLEAGIHRLEDKSLPDLKEEIRQLEDKSKTDLKAGTQQLEDKSKVERIMNQGTLPEALDLCPKAYYEVTIHEGRYHQIKRMFEACGSEVLYLKRISMGSLELDESLSPGEYRRLTDKEIERLRE